MRITSLRFGGLGVFGDDVVVPLDELEGATVVAVVGPNGAGKTSALEMVPGALYRTTPSRGGLAGLAHSRNAHVELGLALNGADYAARVLIDGLARPPKSEAYLSDANGPTNERGKVRDYDRAIAERFPSREVLLSSVFAAQSGEGRLLNLPPSKRKALFAEMLGLGRLQEIADSARDRFHEVEAEIARLEERAAVHSETAGGLTDAVAALRGAEEAQQEATQRVKSVQKATDDAWARIAKWEAQRSLLAEEAAKTGADLTAAEKALEIAQNGQSDALEAILRAQDKRTTLAARLCGRESVERAVTEGSRATTQIENAEAEISGLWATREKERTDREACAAAKREAEAALREAASDWEKSRAELAHRLGVVQQQLVSTERQAAGISDALCGGEGKWSGCSLIASAVAARDLLEDLRAQVQAAQDDLGDDSEPQGVTAARAALEDLPPEPAETVSAGQIESLQDHVAGLRKVVSTANDARAKLAGMDEARERLADVEREEEALRKRAALTKERLREAEGAEHDARKAISVAKEALREHDSRKPPAPDSDVDAAREAESAAIAEAAKCKAAVEAAEKSAAQLEGVKAEIREQTADLDDWRHLRRAFGPDGIQALEIDAAGPEVSRLTNELLHACYGSRFSISLETAVLKADGKATKETFEIRVLDSERGTEGPADQLSGGEQVLVSEALSLALAIFNSRRSDVPLLTLFRDECAGALSSENAVRYVEMLRRAMDLGGFERVFFVAHQRELWPLADAALVFEEGTIRAESNPGSLA